MPVAAMPDCSYSAAADSSVVAGYSDCLKEALKFLLEKEKLPPQHPVVAGLAMHLARPGARQSLRRLATAHSTGGDNQRRQASIPSRSEQQLHSVRGNTSLIGRSRVAAAIQKNKISSSDDDGRNEECSDSENEGSRALVGSPKQEEEQEPSSSSDPGNQSRARDINNELRRNLQNIVDNLQDVIDGNDNSSDADTDEEEDNDAADDPIYDVNDNDLDIEIETILGDEELRRELVRLVYQGCDLIAVAPQRPTVYPSPPCSPVYASIATPAQYLPHEQFEHVIQHLPNDRL